MAGWIVAGVLAVAAAMILGAAGQVGRKVTDWAWSRMTDWRKDQQDAESDDNGDWSPAKVVGKFVEYFVTMFGFIVVMEVLAPILVGTSRGAYLRLVVWGVLAFRVIGEWTWWDSWRKIVGLTDAQKELLQKRRIRTKMLVTSVTGVIAGMFFLGALGDLRIANRLAQERCVSTLPGLVDNYISAERLGKEISELTDEDKLRPWIPVGADEWRERSEVCGARE